MEGEDRRGRMGEVWAEGRAEDGIEQSRRDDKQNESETWEGKGWSGVEWMGWGGTRELNPRSQRLGVGGSSSWIHQGAHSLREKSCPRFPRRPVPGMLPSAFPHCTHLPL